MPPSVLCQPAGCLLFGARMTDTNQSCQFSLSSALEQPQGASVEVSKLPKGLPHPATTAQPAPALSWKAALEELSSTSTSRDGELVGRLQLCVSALSAQKDSVWRDNGVLGGMRRALELAQGGQLEAARQVCSELLSLATIVERRWRLNDGRPLPGASSQSSGSPCSSSISSGGFSAFRQPSQGAPADPSASSCSSDCSDGDSAPTALFSPQQQQHGWASGSKRACPGSSSSGVAVVPESSPAAPLPTGSQLGPPPKRARQAAAAAAEPPCHSARPTSNAQQQQQQQAGDAAKSRHLLRSVEAALHLGNAEAVAAPERDLFGAVTSSSNSCEDEEASPKPGATVTWQGSLKHKLGGTVIELCPMSAVLPEGFSEQFPAAIYASELQHRRQVSLGKHAVCRCSLGRLTARQLQGLATLAQCQLVAVVRLQHCALHLVPYFDNGRTMRMVGFLKALAA